MNPLEGTDFSTELFVRGYLKRILKDVKRNNCTEIQLNLYHGA